MKRIDLQIWLDDLLQCKRFSDYCPNGLQVEGRAEVRRIACGVTASRALIEHAIQKGADTIIVHHGWFWRNEDPRVMGIKRDRLRLLLASDINLFAYHLPLDAHPELGNNAQLAKVLGWHFERNHEAQPLVFIGEPPHPMPAGEVARSVAARLVREPLLIGDPAKNIRKVAWCTGAAQGYLEAAIEAGVDLFLSGEISEQTVHLARESGVAYLAAGHHATERYGIRALGARIAETFDVEAIFLDEENPV
jgi:dinuclear metal center YbgI/SA1388 family protein